MIIMKFKSDLLEQSRQKLLQSLRDNYPDIIFSFTNNELSWHLKEDEVNPSLDVANLTAQLLTFVNGFISGVSMFHTWYD